MFGTDPNLPQSKLERRPNQEALNEQRDKYITQAIEEVLKTKRDQLRDHPNHNSFKMMVEDELRAKTGMVPSSEDAPFVSGTVQAGYRTPENSVFEGEYGSQRVTEVITKHFGVGIEDYEGLEEAIKNSLS